MDETVIRISCPSITGAHGLNHMATRQPTTNVAAAARVIENYGIPLLDEVVFHMILKTE